MTTSDRCSDIPVDTWVTENRAPTHEDRCPNQPTWYIGVAGNDRTQYMRLCDEHAMTHLAEEAGYNPETRIGTIGARLINTKATEYAELTGKLEINDDK